MHSLPHLFRKNMAGGGAAAATACTCECNLQTAATSVDCCRYMAFYMSNNMDATMGSGMHAHMLSPSEPVSYQDAGSWARCAHEPDQAAQTAL